MATVTDLPVDWIHPNDWGDTDLPVCPACGADTPLVIRYGLIRQSPEEWAAFHASGYVWGGCMVPGPNRQCRICSAQYQYDPPASDGPIGTN